MKAITLQDLLDLPVGSAADAEIPMWVDGGCVASAGGAEAVQDDICPSTGSVLARVHQAGSADIDRAVAAAARSQPAWAAMGVHERAARLAEWGRRVVEAAPPAGPARRPRLRDRSHLHGGQRGQGRQVPPDHRRGRPRAPRAHHPGHARRAALHRARPLGRGGSPVRLQPSHPVHVHEGRPRARRRQLGGAQAGRTDPAVAAGDRLAGRGSAACGGVQRGAGRRGRGRGPGRAPRCAPGVVHRLAAHRAGRAGPGRRVGGDQEPHPGAGRQEPHPDLR